MRAFKFPPFFESLIFRHKCDICGFEGFIVYIPELDRWYCSFCLEIVVNLLEVCMKK